MLYNIDFFIIIIIYTDNSYIKDLDPRNLHWKYHTELG